jgi:predicted transcriptional regulator
MVNIMLVILESANEAADGDDDDTKKMTTITNITYTALVKHPSLKGYWKLLIENGLLIYDLDTEMFKITGKGRKFLKVYSGRNGC